jgi:toxin ParE1/3/4
VKLVLDRQARADLVSIRDYLLEHAGEAAANNVRDYLRARMSLLLRLPFAGRQSSNSAIRMLAPTKYPYRIYYTLRGKTVVILHIRHASRRPPDVGKM